MPLDTTNDTNATALAPLSAGLIELIILYQETSVEYPDLKPVTLASWIYISEWGHSDLAKSDKNYAHLRYRAYLQDFSNNGGYYCHFTDVSNFIDGYWTDLEMKYGDKLADSSTSDETFLDLLYPDNEEAHSEILELIATAAELLAQQDLHGMNLEVDEQANCCLEGYENASLKPEATYIRSPNQSSRNNRSIDMIVMHYTTSRNINGSISHFKNPKSGVSAHYIIGRDGALVQMVNDHNKAWHARSLNRRSIGIEHVAAPGDKITPPQEAASLELLRWLIDEYDIETSKIVPHVFVNATKCCGNLFDDYKDDGADKYDRVVQIEALQKWLSLKLTGTGSILSANETMTTEAFVARPNINADVAAAVKEKLSGGHAGYLSMKIRTIFPSENNWDRRARSVGTELSKIPAYKGFRLYTNQVNPFWHENETIQTFQNYVIRKLKKYLRTSS